MIQQNYILLLQVLSSNSCNTHIAYSAQFIQITFQATYIQLIVNQPLKAYFLIIQLIVNNSLKLCHSHTANSSE